MSSPNGTGLPLDGSEARLRLRGLRIRSFRGIHDLTLDFRRGNETLDLVVLAGDNGSGKTSVLEAIALLFRNDARLPPGAPPLEEQSRFGSRGFQIEGRIWKRDLEPDRHIERGEAGFWPSPYPSMLAQRSKLGWDNIDSADLWGGELEPGDTHRLEPRIEYFSAYRSLYLKRANIPSSPASTTRERRLAHLKKRIINTFHRHAYDKIAGRVTGKSPFERIQEFWNRFTGSGWVLDVLPIRNDPGSDYEVVLREPTMLPQDITSLAMAREVAPDRLDIPRMVPLESLSSGEQALMEFAGALIFRDKPADIVLIDEPEQHLHVQWQRHLLHELRKLSPASQFIVATHSIPMLEAVLSNERFILYKENDPRRELVTAAETDAPAFEDQ